jgi:hypothetical protein
MEGVGAGNGSALRCLFQNHQGILGIMPSFQKLLAKRICVVLVLLFPPFLSASRYNTQVTLEVIVKHEVVNNIKEIRSSF